MLALGILSVWFMTSERISMPPLLTFVVAVGFSALVVGLLMPPVRLGVKMRREKRAERERDRMEEIIERARGGRNL